MAMFAAISTSMSFNTTLASTLLAAVMASGHAFAEEAPSLPLTQLPLSQGVMDSAHYGFRWDASRAQKDRVEFSFNASASFPLALAVRGYDIDINREVRVMLNGTPLGFLTKAYQTSKT